MKPSCRKTLALLPLLIALLFSITPAEAAPDELAVHDGRVTGRLTSDTGVTYLLDLPVPDDPYPAERLTVEYARFAEGNVHAALRSIGQSAEGAVHTDGDSFLFSGNWKAEAAADITREESASQAVQIGLAFFDALGVSVEREPKSISRPYEFDDADQRYWTFFSEPQALSDYFRAQFDSPRRRRARPEQSAYTSVEFAVLLDGMRLEDNPSYPAEYADEPDAKVGLSVTARVIVSDSGLLVEAAAGSIPRTVSRTSIEPLPDWEPYLREYIKSLDVWPNAYAEQTFYHEGLGMEITEYARQSVVTGMQPRLAAISRDEWMPVWTVTIEEIPVR